MASTPRCVPHYWRRITSGARKGSWKCSVCGVIRSNRIHDPADNA